MTLSPDTWFGLSLLFLGAMVLGTGLVVGEILGTILMGRQKP